MPSGRDPRDLRGRRASRLEAVAPKPEAPADGAPRAEWMATQGERGDATPQASVPEAWVPVVVRRGAGPVAPVSRGVDRIPYRRLCRPRLRGRHVVSACAPRDGGNPAGTELVGAARRVRPLLRSRPRRPGRPFRNFAGAGGVEAGVPSRAGRTRRDGSAAEARPPRRPIRRTNRPIDPAAGVPCRFPRVPAIARRPDSTSPRRTTPPAGDETRIIPRSRVFGKSTFASSRLWSARRTLHCQAGRASDAKPPRREATQSRTGSGKKLQRESQRVRV